MNARSLMFVALLIPSLASQSATVVAREWRDVTGKYRVEAEFVALQDGVVRLRKEDGQVLTMPLKKLSPADQEFVRQKSVQEDPGIPELLEPQPRAVLDNGRRDRADTLVWEFKWGEVEGAEAYELFVIGGTASVPLVKRVVDKPFYRLTSRCYVIGRNRHGWTWKVRAIRDGQPLPWSKTRSFDVEPLGTDPPEQEVAKAADANPPKSTLPKQNDVLEGLWRVKGFVGREAAHEENELAACGLLVDIQEDKATLLCGAIDEEGIKQWTLRVSPYEAPKRFELTREGPPLPAKYVGLPDTVRGTYEFVDDVLRIGFIGELNAMPEAANSAAVADQVLLDLERVEPEYAEALMALQGLWRQTEVISFGHSEHKEARVLVEGECVVSAEKGVAAHLPGRFRLHPPLQSAPAGMSAFEQFTGPETTWVDWREITFLGSSGADGQVGGLLGRTDDGRIVIWAGLGGVVWERVTAEDLAAEELKRVMSIELLAEKKLALQEFVVRHPDTQAAQTAGEELQRMPPDEEIRGIDGAEMLERAREHLRAGHPRAAKHGFQGVIDDYAGTEAARTAKEELDRMPPDDQIDEIEAATMLKSAREKLNSYHDLKQKISLQHRKQLKASAEQQLRDLIKAYPKTKAAEEARRLLDPALQREKRAAQLLDLAKQLLPNNPEAGKRRLKQLVKDFAGTKAAEEAKRLLEEAK